MRSLYLMLPLLLPLAMSAPTALEAQHSPLSLDIRGGYSLPIGDFSDNTDSDFGFGAGVVFSLTPMVGIYGGWGRDSFQCASVACGDDSRVTLSGFEAGAKFMLPSRGGARPWAKAGAVWHAMEFDGEIFRAESDRSLGFQGAIGMDFPLGRVLSVSPSLRLNLMDIEDDGFFDRSEVRYLSFDIGAHIHFPRD